MVEEILTRNAKQLGTVEFALKICNFCPETDIVQGELYCNNTIQKYSMPCYFLQVR